MFKLCAGDKWENANSLSDCLKIVFPNGPYKIFKMDNQEETVIEQSRGHQYFISVCTNPGGKVTGYLTDFFPGESFKIVGFTDFDDKSVATWDSNNESWEIRKGFPEIPIS